MDFIFIITINKKTIMKLLCMFSKVLTLDTDIKRIKTETNNNKIVIYYNKHNDTELFLIFPYTDIRINKTIIIQQKTNKDIFFTINSLNKLVDLHNNYKVPWKLYENKIILLHDNQLQFIDIELK